MRQVLGALLAVGLIAVGCSDGDGGEEPGEASDSEHRVIGELTSSWTWVPADALQEDWEGPAGAEVIVGGGDVDPRHVLRSEDVPGPEELDLQSAARVQVGPDGDAWVLSYGVAIRLEDEAPRQFVDVGDVTAMAVGPGGAFAATNGSSVITVQPGDDEPQVLTDNRSGLLGVNGLAYGSGGSLLAGGIFDLRVAEVGADGAQDGLIGQGVEDVGPIAFVTVLPDDRIAFAIWESWATDDSPGVFSLWLLVDGVPQPISSDEGTTRDGLTSLAPAPDGDLLVTAGDQIERVDVDTGESESLVDLSGAQGTFSAAADGDDLVFLADGRLWRLASAFD